MVFEIYWKLSFMGTLEDTRTVWSDWNLVLDQISNNTHETKKQCLVNYCEPELDKLRDLSETQKDERHCNLRLGRWRSATRVRSHLIPTTLDHRSNNGRVRVSNRFNLFLWSHGKDHSNRRWEHIRSYITHLCRIAWKPYQITPNLDFTIFAEWLYMYLQDNCIWRITVFAG